jgi:hypothetical protein
VPLLILQKLCQVVFLQQRKQNHYVNQHTYITLYSQYCTYTRYSLCCMYFCSNS